MIESILKQVTSYQLRRYVYKKQTKNHVVLSKNLNNLLANDLTSLLDTVLFGNANQIKEQFKALSPTEIILYIIKLYKIYSPEKYLQIILKISQECLNYIADTYTHQNIDKLTALIAQLY